MIKKKLALPAITLLLILLCYNSQAQTPTLTITDKSANVHLHTLSIDIKVVGSIATTTIEMIFFNTGNRIQEGELLFPLPQGCSVSRYAIDINGKLREAVPVEKQKGTEAFEAIARRQVDPGLLEKTTGNNFKTRIYPIPANGSRTVLIAYQEELPFNNNNLLHYYLPLDYKKAINHFTLTVNVLQSTFKPQFEELPDNRITFNEWNNNYTATIEKNNFLPDHSLSFNIPKSSDVPEAMMQQVGRNYYFLVNSFIKKESIAKPIPNNITVIWDISLSGLNRNIKQEIAVLQSYINTKKNITVTLATLNNTFNKIGTYPIKDGDWSILKKSIENFTYDGGTNFSKINLHTIASDEYLFFTDGLSTLSEPRFELFSKPVYTITSSPKADYAILQSIALQTGAAFVNLNAVKATDAVKLLTTQTLSLICIKQNTDISEIYPSIPQPVISNTSVTGISTKENTVIILQYGYGNKIIFEKTVSLNYNTHQLTQTNLQKIWAQKKIAELEINYDNNKDVINQLGKRFSIVTKNTSLIVLENIMDYVQYEIEPPAELRADYDKIIKERLTIRQTQQVLAMNNAFSYFEDLMQWWNKDYINITAPVIKKKKDIIVDTTKMNNENDIALQEVVVSSYYSTSKQEEKKAPPNADMEIVLQGKAAGVFIAGQSGDHTSERKRSMTAAASTVKRTEITEDENNATINIKPWSPERIYLKTLVTTAKEKQYTKYLALRKEYIYTPSFYFDVASHFFQQKDSLTGMLILSNLAELDMENHELYKLLGFKLKETGNYNEEAYIYRKVLQWRPQEPQSYRDYGLALADAGLYQQALDTLYTSINKQYAENIMESYDGIEEIIVTEINQLISLHGKQLDVSKIDKKLIHTMPVDVRVVLSWNMNDTDIDLWVTDPNAEKCYYNNKATILGGRLSDDFTQGYGPEQFLLKRAIKGKYHIEIDFYGEHQLKLAGPTTIMAEIFTHYGTVQQKRKIITVQLDNKEDKHTLIGDFSFDK